MRRGRTRLEADCFVARLDRLLVAGERQQPLCSIEVACRADGRELGHPAEIRAGRRRPPRGRVRAPPQLEGHRMARHELAHAAEVCDRLLEAADAYERGRPLTEHGRVGRGERQEAIEELDGPLVLSAVRGETTEQLDRLEIGGLLAKDRRVGILGLGDPTLPEQHRAALPKRAKPLDVRAGGGRLGSRISRHPAPHPE